MSTATRPFPRIPEFPLAPTALQRWIRFSAKGGIGKARAKVDRVSEDGDKDLMMLEGDEIIVLMDLKDQTYLVSLSYIEQGQETRSCAALEADCLR